MNFGTDVFSFYKKKSRASVSFVKIGAVKIML